ncbi:MAG TPA: TonB-dependent receptor [Verrucomicrobia bacterium]|nr:TonB-dependent receptor [Verrucomicrobiota bacterium]HOP98341.1 TonB-dependent receptor [Verrucomicrobiota bacterium]
MANDVLSTDQKALRINLDARRYGTFAEIGAGQEVARWFFRVGGASGTVAKTISAYDMAVSDAIYGHADRYVSRQRLRSMLDYEFNLLLERLNTTRGDKTAFFVFADTVATSGYTQRQDGHGWMGIRFQPEPHSEPSEIVIHVRMLDKESVRQQEALGIMGVNLIYGTFYFHSDPQALIRSLLDNLTWERVEVDMIGLTGPVFASVDNRLMALQLVKQGLTEAAMFTADGEAVQWGEVLYKRPVLVQRGSFHPVTKATLDVLERAHEKFLAEPELKGQTPVVLMEMTLRHLTAGDRINEEDFVHRAETLRALGKTVLISNFRRFHRLAAYLSRYTNKALGIAVGASKLKEIFDESFYNENEGGLLGGLGQLFKNPARLYVYPSLDFSTGRTLTAENFPVAPHLKHLQAYLLENGFIQDITPSDPGFLPIRSRDVLEKIQAGNDEWEQHVPAQIVEVIRKQKLFGCKG